MLTALYLLEIVMLAFFPRQNRAISVKIPRRARRDPSYRMCLPMGAIALVSLALGVGSSQVISLLSALVL